MSDTGILTADERKEKIRINVAHLSSRFNEVLWHSKEKLIRIEGLKPNFMPEFYERWNELDKRYREYIDGKIDWDGTTTQMEFMPLSKAPYQRIEIDRDVENYARDLYCWFALQVKDL